MSSEIRNWPSGRLRRRVGVVLGVALMLLLSGCERRGVQGSSGATAECEPGAETQDEPGVLRGRVLAPAAQLAHNGAREQKSGFSAVVSYVFTTGWLVPPAHAAPLDGELPVPGVQVELYQVGPDGGQVGETLAQATTNAIGQWCLRLPPGVEAGPQLMLQARTDAPEAKDVRLRRSLAAEFSTDISSGSEALTRLLQEHKVDFTKLAHATYLNMESIADTRMDLLTPVKLQPGMTAQQAVEQILNTLREDERLEEKFEALARVK